MNITIKYFANMRELMGRSEDSLNLDEEQMTVAELWERVNPDESMPTNTLIAVNMEYTDRNQTVKHGDEVAFFPPVTGG